MSSFGPPEHQLAGWAEPGFKEILYLIYNFKVKGWLKPVSKSVLGVFANLLQTGSLGLIPVAVKQGHCVEWCELRHWI